MAAFPLCAIILASGYLAILAVDVPLVGAMAGAATRCSTGLLLSLAHLGAEIDRGGFAVTRPHLASFVPYYGLGFLWVVARSNLRPLMRRSLALTFALCVLALHDGAPHLPAGLGQRGGSRQGVAEGIAAGEAQRLGADAATDLRFQDFGNQGAALSTILANQQGAVAQTFPALGGQFGLSQAQVQAPFLSLQALGQLRL